MQKDHEPLGKSECNTILAALRHYQVAQGIPFGLPQGIVDIASDGGTEQPLGNEDIDALCQDINCMGLWLGGQR